MKNYIWYERYRPKALDDMALDGATRAKLQSYLDDKDIPHLLFYGPQGSGKTTMAHIIIEAFNAVKLELNASSQDRGIDTIKGIVKQFAQSMPPAGRLKVVLLDEADHLTPDAQKALRNTMERYSESCRFILTANYLDKILRPIQSRCTQFNFSQYNVRAVAKHLTHICQAEKVQFNPDELDQLVALHYPDIRTLVNALQLGTNEGVFTLAKAGRTGVMLTAQSREEMLSLLTEGDVRKLREMVAGITDYTQLYRWLFDVGIDALYGDDYEVCATAAVRVAEYMWRDATVPDREMNFIACVIAVLHAGGVKLLWR